MMEGARNQLAVSCLVRAYTPGRPASNTRFIASRGGDLACFAHGNSEGVCGYTEDGRPVYNMEWASLSTANSLWQRRQHGITGQVRFGTTGGPIADVRDFRNVGLLPTSDCLGRSAGEVFPPPQLAAAGEEFSYSQRPGDGNLIEVEARSENYRFVWTIDPDRAWNPTRVEQYMRDPSEPASAFALAYAVESEYERFGEAWAPVKVTYLSAPEERVHAVTELTYAKVNSPDLPDFLTPTDVGFRTGSIVNVSGDGPARQMRWTGSDLIAHDEFYARVESGELKPDPWIEEQKRNPRPVRYGDRPAADRLRDDPERLLVRERLAFALQRSNSNDPWDTYVAEFIKRFQLEPEQTDRCLAILKDSKGRRNQLLLARRERLEELEKRPTKADSDIRLAREELARLLAPVDQIFEQLRGRLDRIPTRKQREAVEKGR